MIVKVIYRSANDLSRR